MPVASRSLIQRDLAVLAHAGSEWPVLARRAGAILERRLPFDKACWHTLDPQTRVLTGAIKDGIDRDEPRVPRYESSVPDVNKFDFLARCSPPVGILSRATHGNLLSSPRYRDLLQEMGIAWEIRAVFVVDGTAWGACSLYRGPGSPDFDDHDLDLLAASSRLLGTAFRRSMVLHGQAMSASPDGPGLILLDDDDATVSMTAAASRWLEELVDLGVAGERRLPAPVYAVAARARALATAPGGADVQARARAFTRSGRWLLLYAARLTAQGRPLTSVIVEPARPSEVALLVLHAHGLSQRELDVAGAAIRGLSTATIADELHLSPLTVQHYLKSIFEKTGVHSRRQLVASILSGEVQAAAGI